MTIEQEFFKSFNIPTKFYTTINLGDLDNNYQEVSASTLQELFEENNFWFDEYIEDINDFHDWEEKYPPITPEIVLELIKIIADKGYSFKVFEAEDMFNNGIKYITNAITDIKHDIYGRGKTIDQAVISLCIQLKDEIQDQVKALFNAM